MNKRLKYTTLKGLISKTRQYSLYTFISGRMCHVKHGWVNVILTEKLRKEIIEHFSEFLNRDISNTTSTCGLFERLIIEKRDLKVHYIAGQNYPSELRTLRGLI